MKAVLTFKMPDEETEYLAAIHSLAILSALRSACGYLRGQLKYAELSEETRAELESLRTLLVEELDLLPGALRQ